MKEKIAIIGGGIAGVTAAKKLANKYDVTIYEKSKSLGGRMAVRYNDDFEFDFGAQFFLAKDEEFKELLENRELQKNLDIWQARFVEIDQNKILKHRLWNQNYPHYVASPRMNVFVKKLAEGLNVQTSTKITSTHKKNGKWVLNCEDKIVGEFDFVILAIPSQQVAELISSDVSFYEDVQNIKMVGCFSSMIGFKKHLILDFDTALVKNSKISWVSINNTKPNRNSKTSIVAHSTNDFAEENSHKDKFDVQEELLETISEIIGINCHDADHKDIHHWRYANIKRVSKNNFFYDPKLQVGACGDWCIQGRVEYAFKSALFLSQTIL